MFEHRKNMHIVQDTNTRHLPILAAMSDWDSLPTMA